MAFDRDGWNVIGGQSRSGDAPAMYSYSTTDNLATMNTEGYFNSVSDTVAVNDLIYVVDSATPTTTLVTVRSNASGVVDVSDGTAIAVTDSD